MKRISILLTGLALCAAPLARAQDAATQEQLSQLRGKIEELTESEQALKTRLAEMTREVISLREQVGRQPAGNFASAEDLKLLAEKLKEVDAKRKDDAENVKVQLKKLQDLLLRSPGSGGKKGGGTTGTSTTHADPSPTDNATGYEYVVQSGDTLSAVVAAYKAKGITVSMSQIIKANPGLKPENMKVGQKIFIPATSSGGATP
jgi:LysM repeat protein